MTWSQNEAYNPGRQGARPGLANRATALPMLLSILVCPVLAVAATRHTYTHDGLMIGQYPVLMPMTLSVTERIAVGFVTYSVLKLVAGRARQVHRVSHLVSLALLVRHIAVPPGG